MKRSTSALGVLAAAALLVATGRAPARADATVTQTFDLRPGWNAIYIEVEPEANSPAEVFAGLAVTSVWTRLDKNSSVEFIRDPAEGLLGQAGWYCYFPSEKEAPLTNLHAVFPGQAYLVKLEGEEAATLTVTGRPSVAGIRWMADSFNLTGFRVNPAAAPTFASFFEPSSSHAGQAIYRLNNEAGAWELVDDPGSVAIRRGEAYWVYCAGASQYQGPLEVRPPQYNGMHYGQLLEALTLLLRNGSNRTVAVSVTALSADIDLAYRTYNTEQGVFEWPPLDGMPPVSLAPGESQNLRIAVRRESLQTDRAESVLQISDGQGFQMLVPVSVEKEDSQ